MQQKTKIVLVEDDVPISNMYKIKLEASGFEVAQAYDGKEGLKVIEQVQPDLILLDIKMPIMNGAEMLKIMRETAWGRDINVIILTNISRDEAPHELRLLHVDRYIVKVHITPNQLVDVINLVIKDRNHRLHKVQD